MIEKGRGSPIVLVPGIQGRWEWMAPAVDALALRHRVLTFSLGDVRGPAFFDDWSAHIDALLERVDTPTVTLAGVSFGGLIAAYYAATRPSRVARLILVSTPSPLWQLDPRSAGYVQRPRLALPLFAWRAIGRLAPEIGAALPTTKERLRFSTTHIARALRWPLSPAHMAAWVHEWRANDLAGAVRRVAAPTLVITGEPDLDRVVPVTSSLEYLTLITGARHATLTRTGHLGFIVRPHDFARLVTHFMEAPDDTTERGAGEFTTCT